MDSMGIPVKKDNMKTALGARYAVTGAAYTWYNNQILIGQAIWQKRKGMYVSVKLQHEDRVRALSVTGTTVGTSRDLHDMHVYIFKAIQI